MNQDLSTIFRIGLPVFANKFNIYCNLRRGVYGMECSPALDTVTEKPRFNNSERSDADGYSYK
jgi:hypothetical protein